MSIRIVRLGSPRADDEGLRIGTVRRPPRGIMKADFAAKNFYDVWYPVLAPSEALLKSHFPIASDDDWRRFKRRFLQEMKVPHAIKTLDLLAAFSHRSNFSVGCYCVDEEHCHRSLLRELFIARDALIG